MTPAAGQWVARRGEAPVVVATSAWNGLAFSSHQTWAWRRAELTALAETPFRGADGERLSMATIRTLPPRLWGADRLRAVVRRLVGALAPALAARPREARVACVLCLSERFARPDPAVARQRGLVAGELADALAAQGIAARPEVVALGHAALAHGLAAALPALADRAADVVVVGGVDTYYDPDVVAALLEDDRLFDAEHPEGVIPGEGGAFAVLARPDTARRAAWTASTVIEAVGVDRERDASATGDALTRALRAATEPLRAARGTVDWWLGDMTHEEHRVREFQLAFPRASVGVSGPEARFEFLPPLLGDLGAATMPTALAIAREGFERGDPDAATCVLMGSSEGGARGAVLLARRR